MLADEAEIYVRGGSGGDGCVSFRREKYVPRGGPDGGDGGVGGSVLAEAAPGVDTLLDFKGRHHWIASGGQPGAGKNQSGRAGDDLILKLPLGTLIFDRETDLLLKDLIAPSVRICVARGGRGGHGNRRYATSTHQTPREYEPGEAGEERWIRLELKLMADVGLVGLPNAGKSTLLSRMSRARPKIAAYPFTTLVPQLGITELTDGRRLVLADIPGLIEGAHQGAGLGDAFLKHIERTRVIVHLVDVGTVSDPEKAEADYRTIRNELSRYSPVLASKREIVAATKIDLTDGEKTAAGLARRLDVKLFPISAVANRGLAELGEAIWKALQEEKGQCDTAASVDVRRMA
jgi:GTP-binding protein